MGRRAYTSSTRFRARQLSPEQQVNYDVYRPQIQVLIASQRFRDYEMPANSDTTFWTDLGYTARRPFRTLQDYNNWIAQLHDVPRYFHEQMDEMRAGMKRGFTPPKVTMEGRDSSITAVTDATPEASLFYTPFKDMPGVSAAEQADLRAAGGHDDSRCRAARVCRIAEVHAHRVRSRAAARHCRPRTCRTARISTAPRSGSSPRSIWIPADIHSLGEAEVARLHGEMLAVMKETGFNGDFPAFLQFLRTDPQFYAKSADELLMRASWIAKKFDGKASLFFGYLPRARFAIKPVPDDLAPFYTAGRGGPGVYLLNTYNLPSRPLYNLTALTLHESAPGHAFQMPIAMEHASQPRVSPAHLHLGLRRRLGALLRAAGARDEHV